ncbi:CIC11C00000002128 [Sungouiella intermedia]|uniref:CIC11C00000002128 n=1 Tax=Sungouiella intermedia TaxID=45354 RepID=A0A1L0BYN3_9ASCO|nr:CIC11C00000002128 [[Candida] intermedia]
MMPPQTPRSKSTRSGSNLTPSFTFGLGLLPSFKFASPRNMSLLSSISPHRFFNRLSKGKSDLEHNMDLPGELSQPIEHIHNNRDFFDLSSPKAKNALIDDITDGKSGFDVDSTADLICTATSVDLWSLANDTQTQNATMNLTSIHEEASNNKGSELFLSPEELFLQDPATLQPKETQLLSSPIENDTKKPLASRKRKLSDAPESPSKLLASQIDNYGSPVTPATFSDVTEKSSSKIWTPQLDAALASCYAKYLHFKEQPSEALALKHASQNKVLSRMLFNKTGIERTPKQVSSRLFRINKNRSVRSACSEMDVQSTVQPISNVPTIVSSPLEDILLSPPNIVSPDLAMEEFNMSFIYKSQIQGEHSFSKLVPTDPGSMSVPNIMDIKKFLLIENSVFSSDFDSISSKLSSQRVPVYSMTSQINFRPNEDATSTPASPSTNPKLFSIENGKFLCHLKMKVAQRVSNDDFLSWKSFITLYKDTDNVLLRSREQINGYKTQDGSFELHIPFLNNFWAGYLTFLSNGSNAFDDLKDIKIVQVIYNGDDDSFGTIHGYLTYRFDIARMNQGNTTCSCIRLQSSPDFNVDDNETVLASSSPAKPPSSKANLSVDTELANMNTTPGPMSIPSYNASLLHKFNPNYQQPDPKHLLSMRLVSSSAIYHLDVSYQKSPDAMNTPASMSTLGGRHQSAGQIMPHLPHDAIPLEQHPIPPPSFQAGIPNGQFHAPISQPPQQAMSHNQFPVHYAQGMQMMPIGHGEVPKENMRFEPMGKPMNVPVAPPMLGGLVPPQQWGVMYHGTEPFGQQPINSAPASQVQFFPKNSAPMAIDHKNMSKSGPTITFGPILGYDPSKDMKEHSKKHKSTINFHKFLQNPQVMYKPKKK